MVSQAGAADAFGRRYKQLKGVNLGFDMTFDEITAERRKIFYEGRIVLVWAEGKRGEMVPLNKLDATAHYQAARYNELAKMHSEMVRA